MGKEIDSSFIINALTTLGFDISEQGEFYDVIVPTFRATKDVALEADLIEEIARLYGYENIELEPLKLTLTTKELEHTQELEYDVKRLLATKFDMSEVHSYLWYKTSLLNKLKLKKDNIKLLGKSDDNILRDDLSLTLIDMAKENLKNYSTVSIFEIGTIFRNGDNKRSLSLVISDNYNNLENCFYKAKQIINTLFKVLIIKPLLCI